MKKISLLMVCLLSVWVTKAAITTPVDYSTIFAASATNATTLTLLEKSVSTLAANTWTGPATGTNPTIAANSLSYSTYKDNNLGKQIALTSQSPARQSIFCLTTSATDLTTGTFYLSFLLNVSGAPASNATLACFDKSSVAATKRGQVMIKSTTGGYVLTPQLNATASSTTSSVLAYNTTHLIVIKYEVTTASNSAGAGTVSLYVDPTIGAAEPAAVSSSSATGQTNMDQVKQFEIFQQSALAATVAGFRFSKIWAEVVPETIPVSTSAATTVKDTIATGNGTLGILGSPAYTNYGFCWKTSAGATISDNFVDLGAPSATGAFTASLKKLIPNTTYYAKAFATNSSGTTYGTEVSFLTLASSPAAPTVDGITATSVNVAINENGNPASTTFAIKENNSGKYVQDDGTILSATNIYHTKADWGTKTVTGLTANTSYTFLAKAQNSASATVFGATTIVATLPLAPTSTAASAITSAGFTANWTAPTQGAATFTYTVEYGTASDLLSGTTLVSGILSSNTSQTITGLQPATTYYYRVLSSNASGVSSYSTIQSVTTNHVTPTVGTYSYNGNPQGPTAATNNGTGTSYTFSYASQDGTTYPASSTLPTAAGSYYVTATVDANGNYASASSVATAFTIGKVALSVSTPVASNKVYDGGNSTTITGTLSGIIGSDDVIFNGTGTFVDVTVGAHSVTSTSTLGGSKAGNYTLTQPTGLSAIITAASANSTGGNISVSGITTQDLANTNITVTTGDLVINQNSAIHGIAVNSGAKLTLNSGVTLSTGALTLQNDGSSHGTFVDENTSGGLTVTGTTTVNQYLTTGRNWYVSSPVSGATAAVFNPAGLSNILYSYDETHGSSAPWPAITNNATGLTVMKGYVANMASSGVVTFSGTLNTGAQEIGLTQTSGQVKNGFNLVGNPYPSYLDWSSVTKTNLLTTMWYRTKTTPAPVTGATTYVFDTYNASGNIATSNGATAVTNMIPPMQAFWVHVQTGFASSTLAVNNAQRAHADNSSNTFKAKASLETQPVLRLQVSNGINSDQALVYFNATASNGFDSYDSPKLSNESASMPEIYTLAGSEQLVINGVNDATELALGFTTGEANNFSIKASQFANFASGTQIILRDNLLNYEQDLTLADYNFYSDVTANNETRFTVLFKAPSVATGINQNTTGNVWISLANNQIVVNGANGDTSVAVYNEVGQRLVSQRLTATTKSVGSFVPGVYMVTVTNAGKSATTKVIIK